MSQITVKEIDIVATAKELKAALKSTGSSNKSQVLTTLKNLIQDLPVGTRFLVRPQRMCAIKVMGWANDAPGNKISQRATVIDPHHTFSGVNFIIDAEGFLSLSAGLEFHRPWARLPFSPNSGEPTFELAIQPPYIGSHLAEFI